MQHQKLSQQDISYVDQLTREAGRLAVEMREACSIHTKTGPTDYVTDADLHISTWLREQLQKRFPNDVIVSEEDRHPAFPAEPNAEVTPPPARAWLIDPIDGTEHYVRRDGLYTSMIGFVVDGLSHYGWVYQPTTDTLFYGGVGSGGWKQTGTETPNEYRGYQQIDKHSDIRLMMGWSDRRKHSWIMDLPNVRFVESESLGLKIVKILENEADMFVSMTGKIKLWDTAAPSAIAIGAGLDVGTAAGEALPFPLPRVQHGSSVIIGRPGSISWAIQHLHGHATSSR